MVASPGNPDTKPYGLHRVWITPYQDTDGTVLSETSYRLPLAQTLAFTEAEKFDTLDGDDKTSVALQGSGATVNGSLEAGGLDLTTYAIISGSTLIESGIAPNIKRVVRKRGTDQRPYFRVDGQVISNGGGDNVARIFRCKANGNIKADAKFGTFMVPSIDFLGTPMPGDDDDYLYEIEFNEQKTTLGSTPVPNPLQIPANVTLGAITDTTVALSWGDLPTATSYKVQQSTDDGATFTDVSGEAGTPTDASTVITGLTEATPYQFRVAAVFGDTTGDYCTPVAVTTATGGGS
jgi:hypothetical protein